MHCLMSASVDQTGEIHDLEWSSLSTFSDSASCEDPDAFLKPTNDANERRDDWGSRQILRYYRLKLSLCFPPLVFMTLVMLDTTANAKPQRGVRGLEIFIRYPQESGGRSGAKSTKKIPVNYNSSNAVTNWCGSTLGLWLEMPQGVWHNTSNTRWTRWTRWAWRWSGPMLGLDIFAALQPVWVLDMGCLSKMIKGRSPRISMTTTTVTDAPAVERRSRKRWIVG